MHGWRGQFSQREAHFDAHAVFTPPRDDPATKPRFLVSPRELDGIPDHLHHHPTHQACGLVYLAVAALGAVFFMAVILYGAATAILGRQHFTDCPDQLVENGMIQAGLVNSTAQVVCDRGFELRAPPELQLRCKLVQHKCSLVSPESGEAPVRKCEGEYLYVKHHDPYAEDPDREKNKEVEELRAEAYQEMKGLCIWPGMVSEGAEAIGLATSSGQWSRNKSQLSALSAKGSGTPTRSTATSSFAMLTLILVALGVVVGSAVLRGRAGHPAMAARQPEMAELLEDVVSQADTDRAAAFFDREERVYDGSSS